MKTSVRFLILPAMCQALLCFPAMAAKDDDKSSDKKKEPQEQKQNPAPAPRKAEAQPQKRVEQPAPQKAERQSERKAQAPAAPRKAEAQPQKRVEQPAPQKAERQPERKAQAPAAPKAEKSPERRPEKTAAAPKPERQPENKVQAPPSEGGKKAQKPEVTRNDPPPAQKNRDQSAAPETTKGDRRPAEGKKQDQTAGRTPKPAASDVTGDKGTKDVVPTPPKASKQADGQNADPDRVAKVPQDRRDPDKSKGNPDRVATPPQDASAPGNKKGDPDQVTKLPQDGRTPGNKKGDPDQVAKLPQDGRNPENKKGDPDAKQPMPLPGNRPDVNRPDRNRPETGSTAANPPDRRGRTDNRQTDQTDVADNPTDSRGDRNNKGNRPNRVLDLPGKRPDVPAASRDTDRTRVYQADLDRKARSRAYAEARQDQPRLKPVVRPGQNSREVRRPDLVARNNNSDTWWNSGNRADYNDNNVRIVRNTTVINNNFTRNVNWTTRRSDWGYNPWWNRPQVRPWYGSSWNYGWDQDYYHHHYEYDRWSHGYRPPGYVYTRTAIGWGLIGWSLGALVYNTGYQSYYNPYYARPVVVSGYGEIQYSQPITRIAVSTAPRDEAGVEEITRRSESFMVESQAAFRRQDYLVALELADKAVAESPGDGALHEYRALVLFALGKYGEAAGVLNPVLASGPGWDWSTMIALYDSQQIYTDQLQRLEAYTEQKPDAADMHFLLGYHYMVCGHLDLATPQFDMAYRLMPKDNVSRQLADLTRASARGSAAEAPAEVEKATPDDSPPPPIPLEKLTGVWVSTREGAGAVTLTFKGDGKFTWSYDDNGKTTEFSGDYSLNDDGLLVLDSDQTQMVASVDLPQDREMKFVLAGGQPGDPGLDFKKG